MLQLVLYTPFDWSFIWIIFFVLKLDSWFGVLSSKFNIFDIPSLYYNTNLNSSIICCLFSGDIYIYIYVYIYINISISSFCECKSLENFFERFVILSAILLPIKSLVASAIFWIALFEAVFIPSVVDFLALSKIFWLCYCSCF